MGANLKLRQCERSICVDKVLSNEITLCTDYESLLVPGFVTNMDY